MVELRELLEQYGRVQQKRAKGGLYSLSGFDFQLRLYLADLVESLAREQEWPLLEAFSDIADVSADGTVVIQVKRTLNKASLREAAVELTVLDEFFEKHDSERRAGLRFQVVGMQYDDNLGNLTSGIWHGLEVPADASDRPAKNARLSKIYQEGRLLAPRIERDPWLRAIRAIFQMLDDPFGFLDNAMQLCMRRKPQPSQAFDLAEEVARLFAKHRDVKKPKLIGRILSESDFSALPDPARGTLLGAVPHLSDLRKQRFFDRPDRVAAVTTRLEQIIADRGEVEEDRLPTLWINGRSGSGKSVLLLQTMERVLQSGGGVVLWLDESSDKLLPLLQSWVTQQTDFGSDDLFVFVDDLYGPTKRPGIDFEAIRQLLRMYAGRRWPTLITCGPPEHHADFKRLGALNGFKVHDWLLTPPTATEKQSLLSWFFARTGQFSRSREMGPAFSQEEALMLSMMVELQEGSLEEFANRFKERLDLENITDAMIVPLALNRLYLWPPRSWVEAQDEALRRISEDHDFEMLGGDMRASRRFRLTHPHLSDAIYKAVRNRADGVSRARDLGGAFRRSLDEDIELAALLLERMAEGHERLDICDSEELEYQFVTAWLDLKSQTSADKTRIWTSWAVWHSRAPRIKELLKSQTAPIEMARGILDQSAPSYGSNWLRLWSGYPDHPGLITDAWEWLNIPASSLRPEWSLVWESIGAAFEASGRRDEWDQVGANWLKYYQFVPQWNYVFRQLVKQNSKRVPWELAHFLVTTAPNNRNWPFVFQILLAANETGHATAFPKKFRVQGQLWLTGREDRDEWPFVWKSLTETAIDDVERIELFEAGKRWNEGREDREGWAHVFRMLLETVTDEGECIRLHEQGLRWLVNREDWREWSYVWRTLLNTATDEGERMTLREQGRRWATGREDHDSWTYVWRLLLATCIEERERMELREQGQHWVVGRVELDSWTFVWQLLLETATDAGERLSLFEQGREWLSGREDHNSWAFVWQKLLEISAEAQDSVQNLLALGVNWLQLPGSLKRAQWEFVYEACMTRGIQDEAFIAIGSNWVSSHLGLPGTPGITAKIWSVLRNNRDFVAPRDFLRSTYSMLSRPCDHKSWTYLWEAVWRYKRTPYSTHLLLPFLECPNQSLSAIAWAVSTVARSRRPELIQVLDDWATDNSTDPIGQLVRNVLTKASQDSSSISEDRVSEEHPN